MKEAAFLSSGAEISGLHCVKSMLMCRKAVTSEDMKSSRAEKGVSMIVYCFNHF